MSEIASPLDGLVVLDLTVDRPGSVAGMLLADLGADVIRIETTDGDHRRSDPYVEPDWICWDRGKRTVTVEALDPLIDRTFGDLLGTADIVLLDPTPGAAYGAPLDPQALNAAHPRLAVIWVPPYGASGERYQDLPSDPLLLNAISGFAMWQPARDPEVPIAPVVPIVQYVQGSLAASAAVAAVLERERSGTGQIATISGIDAVGALIATLVNDSLDVEKAYQTGRDAELGPSFRPYRCADGEMLFLATLVAPLFIKALDVLDALEVMVIEGVDGEYLNLFHPTHGRTASAMVEARFATQPRQYWLDRFEAAGVPAEPVQSRAEWLASDAFAATGGRRSFDHPDVGRVETPRHPVHLAPRGEVGGVPVWPSRQGGERPTRGPLHGLRVVDMATFLAGPYAPALFAYWGADVVKIEVGEGDPYRAYGISYLAVNQAKQSLSFDLATTADRDELERVIGGADVFIDNFRPSTREALGLDDDAIERINPRLIHGRLTAFGDDGAWAERPGFDPSIQALSGLMVATGGAATPLNTTTPVHDVGAGVSMALGVLAALWHRHSSGTASAVAGSLAGASSLLQCAEFTDFDRRPPAGVGKVDFIGPSAGRRFYRAVDGWVAIAARDAGELERALAALGASADRIDDDPDGSAARSLAASIIGRPVADVVDDLRAADIAAASAVDRDLSLDDYLNANHLTHVVVDPTFGRCRVMRGPGDWSRSGTTTPGEMSAIGADADRFAADAWGDEANA